MRASVSACGDAGEVAAHQRDVGGLGGDVGARGHGDADIGLRQRRRVVEAVADHRDAAALALQPLDRVDLAVGQHLGDHLVDAGLPRDRLGGRAPIAGEHHDAKAAAP